MKREESIASNGVEVPAAHDSRSNDGRGDYVLDLRQVGRDDLSRAGGKGANLGELIRAGLPVPGGFVVTTVAYERFVAHSRLEETIAKALEVEQGGTTIRDAFNSAPIPRDVEEDILAAYNRLGDGPVAVRSSATAEDLPGAAFAGQQDTFLNVIDAEAVLDAVHGCWASLWNDRAIAYRARLGLDQTTVKLAVVVQRMVTAEAAGVMFTANPVTGMRDEIVIDASPGLGETVVSGLATPDHFVLQKQRSVWRIVEQQLGKREVIVRARPGGGTEHIEGPSAIAEPSLPVQALYQLAELGMTIERHFGHPQDVEWARTDRELFILQARPITALPEPLLRPNVIQRLLAGLVAELLPARPYPLEATTWVPAVYSFLPRFLSLLGLAVLPFDQLFVEEEGVVVRLSGKTAFRPTISILLAPLRLLRQARHYDPARWRSDQVLAEAQKRVRELDARDLQDLSWDGLLAMVREALAIPALIWEVRVRYLPRPILAMGRLRLILALLGHSDLFGTLLFTGVETKTLEENRTLEALATRIRSDPALADAFASNKASELWTALEGQPSGRAFLADFRTFLDDYGHREAGGTMQVSQPTWRQAPEVVLGILQGLAQAQPRPQTGPPAWEVARDKVLGHPLLGLPPVRSAFLRLLTEARYFPQIREDSRFYLTLPLPVLRKTLLELGRRLHVAGVLDAPEDVFHLKLDELEQVEGAWPPSPELADRFRKDVARRRARRAELESTPLVDPRLLGQAEAGGDVLLRGLPGSPGLVEGPARIIRDASEFARLRSGEVLVAPFTNPAWTPIFQRAVAVVVDSGGPLSHAAIVAREYGIPAVMATVDGTRRLADGELIRVDGSRGLVLRADGGGHERP